MRFLNTLNKPYIIFAISSLLFALVDRVLTEDLKFEACVPANCRKGPNISYPFWISDHQESYCGHPNFEITCSDEYSILNISGDDYMIKNISYDNNSVLLANVMLYDSENTCPIPLLNFSLSNTPFVDSFSYTDLYFLYNCSSYPSDATYSIECDTNLTRVSFAVFHLEILEYENYSIESCQSLVQVPVTGENIDNLLALNFTSVLRKGFDLEWNETNCSSCKSSGGRCGFDNNEFICFCSDKPHSRTCNGKSHVIGNIGIGAGASIIGALLSLIGVWCFYKTVKKVISKRRKAKFFNENGGMLLQQQLSSGHGSVEKTKLFESFELKKATNFYNVDRVLGQGGQGTVYKGVLPDRRLVAVKKSKVVDKSNIGHFINKIVILSQINHRNVVNLLGCCLETKVPLLVYELIPNGTLFQHIHNPTKEFPLNWGVRLQIAAEIAGALYYMHYAASRPIYHRDIKSTNILLDDNYKAKISDFGISRLVDVGNSHLTTHVKGTFGYLDPEYFQSNQFNEKSDVYSFGVVLVELLTSQKPIISIPYQESKGLASHFMESMDDDRLFEIIDPELSKEDKIEEMVEVAHLAKACLDSKGKKRPTMKEVTIQLEGIRTSREQSMPRENDESNDVEEAYDDSSSSTGAWDESTSSLTVNINSLL